MIYNKNTPSTLAVVGEVNMQNVNSSHEADGLCRGFTLAEIEAWASEHIKQTKGRLPGTEVPKDFDVGGILRDMATRGQLRECDRHRGHYLVNLRVHP